MESQQTMNGPFTFTDRLGGRWDCSLTLAGARRIDNSDFSAVSDKEFSILQPDREFFARVLGDSNLLCAIVWAVVYPQAEDQLGIDPTKEPEQAEAAFVERIDGPTLQNIKQAFVEALADFFQEQKTALSKLLQVQATMIRRVNEEVEAAMPEIEAEMEATIKRSCKELRSEIRRELSEPHGMKSTAKQAS